MMQDPHGWMVGEIWIWTVVGILVITFLAALIVKLFKK